ncbi:MAG: PAS domain-containing protein [Acidobacteria bacterium]|nr:PAS domain-containing protein [Acidobacteriota bacterium]
MADTFTEPLNILDQIPSGIMVTDTEWRIRYVNESVVRGAGQPREKIIGEHFLVIISDYCKGDSAGELLRVLTRLTQNPPQETVVRRLPFHTADRRRYIRIRVQPYRPAPDVSGYLFFFRDATREGEIDEMKNEFVSMASHEMRTPMTSIKGSLELLLGGYAGELPAEATELLGISLTAVDRLVRLINDLLDISKIESGKMELHLDRLDIGDCIGKSMRSLRALAEAHMVSIRSERSENLPRVLGDRDRLEQVITNLLSNALKYTPAQSEVTILASQVDKMVHVSVRDQGTGIPPDQLEKVFDRFCQLAGAKKGSGLGLTICRALIEQHGGKIWVESPPGQGSTFHFEIPAAPPE